MAFIKRAAAVVVAAGKSSRMGGGPNKVLRKLGERPVLSYCLEVFQQAEIVSDVVIVGRLEDQGEIDSIISQYCSKAIGNFVVGGTERFDSVKNGLEFLTAREPDAVLIHDAARPFLQNQFISNSLSALKNSAGAVIGVPLKDTLKETTPESKVILTHDRSKYWLAQTPQTFLFSEIVQAYRACTPPPYPTDDGAVLEMQGKTVKMVLGSSHNLKVTTPEDWLLAEALLRILNTKSEES